MRRNLELRRQIDQIGLPRSSPLINLASFSRCIWQLFNNSVTMTMYRCWRGTERRRKRKNVGQACQTPADFLEETEIIVGVQWKVGGAGIKSLARCNFYLTALRSFLPVFRWKLVRYRVKGQRNIKGIVSPSVLVTSVPAKLLFTDKGLLSAPEVPPSSRRDR